MSFFGTWKEKITHYIDIRINLMKLGFIERTSNILSYLIFVFISLFLTLSVLIFVGIGIGEFFSSLLDSRTAGFFITAGFYILLLGLMMLIRVPIIKMFAGIFIRIMTAPDPDEETAEEKLKEKTRENIKVE